MLATDRQTHGRTDWNAISTFVKSKKMKIAKHTNISIDKSLKPRREAHLLKWLKTYRLHLKLLPHKPQAKLLVSECTSRCCFKSYDVQKHFGHSLQTYGFTPSCRCTCNLKSPLRTNFFWQTLQVSQVPSLCDSSRCRFSWSDRIKRSEQCLHECGFAPMWTRTWSRTSRFVLNIFSQ